MSRNHALSILTIFLFLLGPVLAFDYTIRTMEINLASDGTLTINGDLLIKTQNKTDAYILGRNDDLVLNDASLNGKTIPLFLDPTGYYLYTNESGKFSIHGELKLKGKTNIMIPGPVATLNIKSNAYEQTYHSLVGRSIPLYAYKPPTRPKFVYNLIIERNENSFNYMIYLEDYQTIKLPLVNGEQVTDVLGAKYEIKGNTLVLYPRVMQVTIKGKLPSLGTYRNPEPGYVVVEWEPIMEVSISTGATPVDESQLPGMYSFFNTRKTYYSSGQSFHITSRKMDMFPGLMFSIPGENVVGAITENGWLIHRSSFSFSNTGLDYLKAELDDWTPLYLSINGPRYLTKKGNDLYISVPKTRHGDAELISLKKMPLGLVSFKHISFPTVSYPISRVNARLYYPDTYQAIPLNTQALHFNWPVELFVILVLSGLAFPFLKKKRYLSLVIGFGLWLLLQVSFVFVLIYLGVVAYLGYKRIERKHKKWLFLGIVGLAVIALILGGLVFLLSSLGGMPTMSGAKKASAAPMVYKEAGLGVIEAASEAGYVTEKEILPVELELPTYSKHLDWKYALLNKNEAPEISVVFIHSWLWKFILFALGACFLGAVARQYRQLGVRARK